MKYNVRVLLGRVPGYGKMNQSVSFTMYSRESVLAKKASLVGSELKTPAVVRIALSTQPNTVAMRT